MQYRHVNDEQISQVMDHLAVVGYKFDSDATEYGFPLPHVTGRKGCEKEYVIDTEGFWETRVIFSCGPHADFVFFRVRLMIQKYSDREIELFLSEASEALRILTPPDSGEFREFTGAVGSEDRAKDNVIFRAIYRREYSPDTFDQFINIFREECIHILSVASEYFTLFVGGEPREQMNSACNDI